MDKGMHCLLPKYDGMGRVNMEIQLRRTLEDNSRLLEMLAKMAEEIKELKKKLEEKEVYGK